MEPFAAGWLSIIPPIVAIVLALLTKEVLSSLLIGILAGTLIYTIGTDGNILMGTLESAFTTMGNKVDFNILVFCSMLGALVYVVAMSGGTKAYGKWAVSKIKGRRSTLLATSGLGVLIFIDDYFNCLSVGTVMRPLCDSYRVARAKLAYIIDSTAAPVCIIAPVSSWAAAVGSSLKGNGVFESDMAAFIASIPWNFYALLSIVMVFFVVFTNYDFGPMRRAEARAVRDTQDVRRDERVLENTLEDRPRDRERGADEEGRGDARQPYLEKDRLHRLRPRLFQRENGGEQHLAERLHRYAVAPDEQRKDKRGGNGQRQPRLYHKLVFAVSGLQHQCFPLYGTP